MERGPQNGDVEEPPGKTAEQARVARLDDLDGAVDALGDGGGGLAEPAAQVQPGREAAGGECAADDQERPGSRHDGEQRRAAAGQQPGPEAEAHHGHRDRVEAVEQDEERDHARADGAARDAGPAQCPDLQRDATRSGRAEQTCRGVTRHRDLVAGAITHARVAVDEHGAEQHDVAEEGEGLEADRERDPLELRVRDLRDAVADRRVRARQRSYEDRGE